MWGGGGWKKENPGPCLSLQQRCLIAHLLVVAHLQELLPCSSGEARCKTHLPFHCFPKGTWKGESQVLEEREKYSYPKPWP